MKKSPLIQLISQDFIEAHAIPSNITYGKAIFDRGAVTLLAREDTRVEAWVGGLDGSVVEGGGSKRRVEFLAQEGVLTWRCTGNPKNHQIFCKHCVAFARELLRLEGNTGAGEEQLI